MVGRLCAPDREYTGQDVNQTGGEENRISERLLLAVTVVATFVAYAGTLGFDFVYDDHEQLVENFRIQSWRFLPSYFTEPVWSHISPWDPSNFYRPIFLLWLRLNYACFGPKPAGWHFTTVALHVLATALVYFVAGRVLRDPLLAWAAALIFGSHPVHVEPVAWVSGSAEPELAVFFLSSFLCYLRWRDGGARRLVWILASLAFYALAVLTKETAMTLPALILAWEWIRPGAPPARLDALPTAQPTAEIAETSPAVATAGPPPLQRLARLAILFAPYGVVSAAYIALRLRALHALGHVFTPLRLSAALLTAPSVLWFYVGRLVWPLGASQFYDLPYLTSLADPRFLASAAAVLLVAAGLTWWGRRSLAVAFASLWMLVPVLPVLDVRVFFQNDCVHDRYLYLPSAGFAMLAASGLARLTARGSRQNWFGFPTLTLGATALLVAGLGAASLAESLYWADDIVLSRRGLQVAPRSVMAINNVANALNRNGKRAEAVALYQHALELRPDFWEPNYNLGLLYYKTGQLDESARYLHQAISINPYDPRELVCLGFVELRRGRTQQATALMRRALEIQPNAPNSHLALGVVLKSEGRLPAALEEFKAAAAFDPNRALARQLIAEVEARLRNAGKALSTGSPVR